LGEDRAFWVATLFTIAVLMAISLFPLGIPLWSGMSADVFLVDQRVYVDGRSWSSVPFQSGGGEVAGRIYSDSPVNVYLDLHDGNYTWSVENTTQTSFNVELKAYSHTLSIYNPSPFLSRVQVVITETRTLIPLTPVHIMMSYLLIALLIGLILYTVSTRERVWR